MFWLLFAPIGTLRFYPVATFFSGSCYRGSEVRNVMRICARNKSQAHKQVRLTDITTKDVICWYSRDPKCDTLWLEHPNIWHEEREGFDTQSPEAYQISRVQVQGDRIYENTRQAMCMFCQVPKCYGLFGPSGLLFHIQHAHPHETPDFVRLLMTELDLLPEKKEHSSCNTSYAQLRTRLGFFWYGYYYLDDGESNRLRFAPRPGAETSKTLADVCEKDLLPWFERTLEDYLNYKHPHMTYVLNPDFDPHNPSVYQLARHLKDENGEGVAGTTQFACMYCRAPTFRYIHGLGGLLSHFGGQHWPSVIPSGPEVFGVKRDFVADVVK